jgi:uncharacterized membrane protein AbrB (regulator of aidB expression)
MLPLDPHTKIVIESIFLLIISSYLLTCLGKAWHPSQYLFCAMGTTLAMDIFIFHAIRPPEVWCMLNTPFLGWVGYMIYGRIVKKYWPRLRYRVAALLTMLLGA